MLAYEHMLVTTNLRYLFVVTGRLRTLNVMAHQKPGYMQNTFNIAKKKNPRKNNNNKKKQNKTNLKCETEEFYQ